MMGIFVRSKIAIALAVVGLLLLALGIGQRTVWLPPETVTASLPASQQSAPVTVIDSSVGKLRGGPVTVNIKSPGKIELAQGRSDDVKAWVGKAAHLTVDGADAGFKSLTSKHADGEAKVPNPAGSDLWVAEESANGQLSYQWQPPADGDWSLLLASDGTAPAPTDITVTAPNDNSTPTAVPLMVLGAVLLVIGILMLIFRPRRRRGGINGPSRRAAVAPSKRATPRGGSGRAFYASLSALPFGRRSRLAAAALTVALGGLAVLGTVAPAANASTSPAPAPGPSSAPASTPPSSPASGPASNPASGPPSSSAQAEPVLLDSQFTRILDAVTNTVSTGDAAKDAKQLTSRVDGSALEIRTGNYQIRSQVASYPEITPVASKLLTKVISTDRSWPRAVMAVTQGDKNPVPQLLTLVQASARENYKLTSAAPLLPGQTFPNVEKSGSATVAADSKDSLQLSPHEALAALGDRLTKKDSQWKDKISDSPYISDVSSYQDEIVKASPDGSFTFAHALVANSSYAFKTADGGSIVVGNLAFTVDGTPKTAGAKLNVADDAAVFSGGKETSTGMQLNFGEPVVLYVPAKGSKDPMTLLAATRGLTGAKFK
ncbi:MAG: hypothetical protein M3017_17910 [Actinomycetota bacterium]|nr:hypothetical protein [Actinomycetota bacterium]